MGSLPFLGLTAFSPAQAQVVTDGTLSTQVSTSDNRNFTIADCLQVGSNLFHSFLQFNVPSAGSVFFDTPVGTRNIIARVTGRSSSTIDGLIRANGSTNLFLLNPNGIQFGPNARLNIGGSFLGSTGESFLFDNGSVFSATTPSPPSLLSVNAPIGLQYGSSPQSIEVQQANLQVEQGQTLALAGGNLAITGGQLNAPQGRISLIAGREGQVDLTHGPQGLQVTPGTMIQRSGEIDLSARAYLDVSGSGGGEISLYGQQIQVRDSAQVLAETLGGSNGLGITIETDQLQILNGGIVSVSTFGGGQAGDLVIEAQDITVQGNRELQDFLPQLFAADIQTAEQFGTGLFALSFGDGDGGKIAITSNELRLNQSGFLATSAFSEGAGGDLVIQANQVTLDAAEITAETFGSGNAGVVDLQAQEIFLRQGGGFFASTFGSGRGGLITLRAQDRVEIVGTTPNGRFNSGVGVNSFRDGNGGVIQIEAPTISLRDGAGVGGVAFNSGAGGTVILRAEEQVLLEGTASQGEDVSNLSTRSQGTGPAGDIEITTQDLLVQGGATVSTSALSSGQAGRLTIRASQAITVEGSDRGGQALSSLRTDSNLNPNASQFRPPTPANVLGGAGDLTILTPNLEVRDGAEITVSSASTGIQAGNLDVQTNLLRLINRGFLRADSSAGSGGNITVRGKNVWLQQNSGITTNATGTASGGNILFNTDTLVALDDSDITANAVAGRGGNINITAQGIFLSPDSDLTTSSSLGVDGEVNINTPETDPSDSTVELSESIKVPPQLAQRCRPGQALGNGQFVNSGRGGVPANPFSLRSYGAVWHDIRSSEELSQVSSAAETSQPAADSQAAPIVEAQGWTSTSKGLKLVAPKQMASAIGLTSSGIC